MPQTKREPIIVSGTPWNRLVLTRNTTLYGMNSDGTGLYSFIRNRRWAERVYSPFTPLNTLLRIRLSGFQSLLLLIYFCFGQNSFSRCTKVWHAQPDWYVTLHFRDQLSAASLGYRSCAKITVFAHVWAESLSSMVFVPAKQLSGRVWTKPKYSRSFLFADLAKSDLWYR